MLDFGVSPGSLRFRCKPLSMHPVRSRARREKRRDCICDTTPGQKCYRGIGGRDVDEKREGKRATTSFLLDALFDKGADHGFDLGSRIGRDHVFASGHCSCQLRHKARRRRKKAPREERGRTESCRFEIVHELLQVWGFLRSRFFWSRRKTHGPASRSANRLGDRRSREGMNRSVSLTSSQVADAVFPPRLVEFAP